MFTCPFGTFAFIRMSFQLCNAPVTFQKCITEIFYDFFGDSLEVFMDDFSIFGNNFDNCLAHLTKILEVCVRKRLVLSWEKSHFMVQEGVVLEHIVSGKALEVDKAKIEVIQTFLSWQPYKIWGAFSSTSTSIEDSYKTLRKSTSHSPPFFAKIKTSSLTNKESVHSWCWSKHWSRHRFFKVLIGTYHSRSCVTLRTTQWEWSWGNG